MQQRTGIQPAGLTTSWSSSSCARSKASPWWLQMFPCDRQQWRALSAGHDLWVSLPHCCPSFIFQISQCPLLRNKRIALRSTDFRESVAGCSKGLEPWLTEALISPDSSSVTKVHWSFRKEITILAEVNRKNYLKNLFQWCKLIFWTVWNLTDMSGGKKLPRWDSEH